MQTQHVCRKSDAALYKRELPLVFPWLTELPSLPASTHKRSYCSGQRLPPSASSYNQSDMARSQAMFPLQGVCNTTPNNGTLEVRNGAWHVVNRASTPEFWPLHWLPPPDKPRIRWRVSGGFPAKVVEHFYYVISNDRAFAWPGRVSLHRLRCPAPVMRLTAVDEAS